MEFEPQARAALDRVRAAVEAAGGTLDDVVAMTVFITDTRFGRVFTVAAARVLLASPTPPAP